MVKRNFNPACFLMNMREPIRHLILHNDRRDDWHLVNPLAYDIAARIERLFRKPNRYAFF